jgi:hypothetical protein
MTGRRVNSKAMAGDIPVIKYDHIGKITLMVAAGNYVMVRRSRCYPAIFTVKEWRALSDTPPVYAAEQGETFHGEHTKRDRS